MSDFNFDFESLNTVYAKTVRDGIDTEKMEFVPIKEFCGKKIKVDGFFFTEGQYGTQVVVVGNGCKINMPKRCVEIFEKIRDNELALKSLLEGHLVIEDIQMKDTKSGTTTIFTLKNR